MKIYNIIILDASGSMRPLQKPSVDGVNETIQSIKASLEKAPTCEQSISLFTFSSIYEEDIHTILRDSPAQHTAELPYSAYEPSGCTPLYDAIGEITTMFRHLLEPEDKALVTIITDGYENSSVRYTAKDIHKIISGLSEKGWVFTYIGANQDAILESERIGIHNALNFSADEEGTREMWRKDARCRSRYMDVMCCCDDKVAPINMNSCYFDVEDEKDGKNKKVGKNAKKEKAGKK